MRQCSWHRFGLRYSYGMSRLNPSWWNHQRHPLHHLQRQIEQELHQSIDLPRGSTVVDVGCGDMPYRPLFENVGANYVGCDLVEGADVLIESGTPIPLEDGLADCVVSFQVLEHVWDLDWYLNECRRLLKPGGWLLLSTHGTWLYHPHPTDYRRWTVDGLPGDIAARGFEIQSNTGLVGPLAWTTQFRLLGFREVLTKVPLLGKLAVPLLSGLMNVRMALEETITPQQIRQTNAAIYVVVARRPL